MSRLHYKTGLSVLCGVQQDRHLSPGNQNQWIEYPPLYPTSALRFAYDNKYSSDQGPREGTFLLEDLSNKRGPALLRGSLGVIVQQNSKLLHFSLPSGPLRPLPSLWDNRPSVLPCEFDLLAIFEFELCTINNMLERLTEYFFDGPNQRWIQCIHFPHCLRSLLPQATELIQ